VSEINYNNDSTVTSGDWFELYNKSASAVNIGNFILTDENFLTPFTIPSGTTIGGNQYLVVCSDTVKFKIRFPSVSNFIGEYQFNLSHSHDKVRLFNATSDLQYSVLYIDSAGWPKGADGYGRTLELADYNVNPNLNTSWFDGCMFGSPGQAYIPCNPDLIFSEINYHSDSIYDSGDWVEVWNRSASSINLSGWTLKDGRDTNIYTIPVLSIPANGYLVLSSDINLFNSIHPNISNKLGNIGFSFSNSGEAIRLFDASGKLHFSVVYRDTVPWAISPDGDGYTLEHISATGKMDDGANWKAGCFLGSPGKVYDPTCFNAIDEKEPNEISILQLNQNEFELKGAKANDKILLTDLSGRILFQHAIENKNIFSIQEFPAGIYILKVLSDKNNFSYKLMKTN
jgi:hypothetical protein